MIRLVTCAAIRNRNNGDVVCGPRHGNCLNTVVRYKICDKVDGETWECGFVDQHNKFMTRAEAWGVADAAGQIRRPTGFERDYQSHRPPNVGDTGLLFSENLW